MSHTPRPVERTCVVCEKKFKGKYSCGNGFEHVVEKKTYYAPAASLMVCWKTEFTVPTSEGQGTITRIPGKTAEFIRGKLETTDPEAQDFFDGYPGCITFAEWEKIYIPEHIRNQQTRDENEKLKRSVQEQNSELERLRAELAKK